MLVQLMKQQLDDNVDCNCTLMGGCGALGVLFKLTCDTYGYTLVRKDMISCL